jgi:broad specificity phosphatase PhoE
MLVQSVAMEEVYLVRHGETEWNQTGRRQGQLDSPLSESGMMEVQRTAQRIESLPVDGVFSSPLGRAISTAQTYAHALDQAITAVDDLRELDHGDMAGMTNEEIERAFPGELARRSRDKYQWRFPNGESYADADLRAASVLRQVAESGSSRPLIVTHEMIARMLLRNLLTLEPKEALTLGLLHSVIYRVHVESKTVIEISS